MKKIMAMLLAASMMITFAACGDKDTDSNSDDGTTTEAAGTTADGGDTEATEEETTIPENAITGDATASDSIVIWGWNDDLKNILDGPFKETNPDLYKRIVFVNAGGTNYYQGKIDEILKDTSNELYPDLMLVEADTVKKYVNGKDLMSLKDLGLTDADWSEQYQYNIDLGSDFDGNYKASFWQATPGCLQIRADLAEKYLGTTDPEVLQNDYLSTWDKLLETAKTVNDASNGKCKLFSGYTDLYRIYCNSRTQGFYDDNDVITLDDSLMAYLEMAKKTYDDELTFNTNQWTGDWYPNMEGDGVETNAAMIYSGCPWFTYWCLNDAWNANTILVQGPQAFFWGGTGISATVGTADKDAAAEIIKTITCDSDFMKKISNLNSDYVNNKGAIDELIADIDADPTKNCARMYGDQNFIKFFKDKADGIDASTIRAEDNEIMGLFNTQVDQYAQGNKDLDTAIADFKAAVHDTMNYLKTE